MSHPKVISSIPHVPIGGGAGSVPAWGRPDLLISAPGGVASATPAHAVLSAGATASLCAGQDINLQSQRNTALAVKSGLTLFTYGKAQNKDKPNAETGMQLHAASGSVSVQAQGNTLHLTADKAVSVSSVTNAITMGSPKHVLLTAGGASLRITNGSITFTTSGSAQFKAAMKELTSGSSSGAADLHFPKVDLVTPKSAPRFSQMVNVMDLLGAAPGTTDALFSVPYKIVGEDGTLLGHGVTNAKGEGLRVYTARAEVVNVFVGEGEWDVHVDVEHPSISEGYGQQIDGGVA
jgi:type VI secretion system secreted protein VgrG